MDIPSELVEAIESEAAQLKHNWMYSFMPAQDCIYLVGYCKICNNGFTSRLPHTFEFKTLLQYLDVPKWGCKPDQDF